MRWWNRCLLGLIAAALTTAGGAQAQVFTPTFLGPRSSSDFGVYLSDGPGELAAEAIWNDPIVTQLEPLPEFFPAESYHQEYYRNNPNAGYCRVVVAPKVAKFRQRFAGRMRQAG